MDDTVCIYMYVIILSKETFLLIRLLSEKNGKDILLNGLNHLPNSERRWGKNYVFNLIKLLFAALAPTVAP